MARLHIGDKVQVIEGSGLDSNRTGYIVTINYKHIASIPELYKPFDSKREVLIQDANDNYFTMFKNRLIIIRAGCNGAKRL
jgi:hypothetical protein